MQIGDCDTQREYSLGNNYNNYRLSKAFSLAFEPNQPLINGCQALFPQR
jgi:hypothetical protein